MASLILLMSFLLVCSPCFIFMLPATFLQPASSVYFFILSRRFFSFSIFSCFLWATSASFLSRNSSSCWRPSSFLLCLSSYYLFWVREIIRIFLLAFLALFTIPLWSSWRFRFPPLRCPYFPCWSRMGFHIVAVHLIEIKKYWQTKSRRFLLRCSVGIGTTAAHYSAEPVLTRRNPRRYPLSFKSNIYQIYQLFINKV